MTARGELAVTDDSQKRERDEGGSLRCGEVIEAQTDEELVEKMQEHVESDHPELQAEYTREKILSIAHEH